MRVVHIIAMCDYIRMVCEFKHVPIIRFSRRCNTTTKQSTWLWLLHRFYTTTFLYTNVWYAYLSQIERWHTSDLPPSNHVRTCEIWISQVWSENHHVRGIHFAPLPIFPIGLFCTLLDFYWIFFRQSHRNLNESVRNMNQLILCRVYQRQQQSHFS